MNFNLNIDNSGVRLAAPQPKGEPQKLLTHYEGDDYIFRIDNSSLEVFVACARSALYHLVHSRIAAPSAALTYGAAIHRGLELWYRYGPSGEAPLMTQMAHAVESEFAQNPVSFTEWRTPTRAIDTLVQYRKQHPVEEFEVLEFGGTRAVEQSFSLPLGTLEIDDHLPYPRSLLVADTGDEAPTSLYVRKIYVYWTGKVDLLIKHQGNRFVMDHKTCSIMGPQFWDQFLLSQQTIGYCWAAAQLWPDDPPVGLWLNAIYGRPPLKSGLARTEFHRERFYYDEDKRNEWRQDVMALVEDFFGHLLAHYFPKMTMWCFGKFGKCQYHDVCRLPSDQRLTALYTNQFVTRTWSPLNEEAH